MIEIYNQQMIYNRKPGELQVSKSLQILDSGLRASDARGVDAAQDLYDLGKRGEDSFKLLGNSGFAKNSFDDYFNEISSIAARHDIPLSFSDRNTLTAAKRSFTNNADAAAFFNNLQGVAENLLTKGDSNQSEKVEGMRMFGMVIPSLTPVVVTNNISNQAMLQAAEKQAEAVAVKAHEVTAEKAVAANDKSGYAVNAIAEKAAVAVIATEALKSAPSAAEIARNELVNSNALRQASELAMAAGGVPPQVAELANVKSLAGNIVEAQDVAAAPAGRGGDLSSLLRFHAANQNGNAAPKVDAKHAELADKLASSGVDLKALASNLQAGMAEKALPTGGPSAASIQNFASIGGNGFERTA